MKSLAGEFSIVVLGAWNPSIFNEDWIKTHLIQDVVDFQIAYPVEDVTAPRRISFSNINFFPGRKKLEVSPQEPTLENMKDCQQLMVKVFNLLSHTPIVEMGINFGFETDDTEELAKLFNMQDNPDILAEFAIKGTMVRRTLHNEGRAGVLNLTIDNYQGNYQLRLNYHYAGMKTQDYRALLQDDYVTTNHDISLALLEKLYGLKLQDQ